MHVICMRFSTKIGLGGSEDRNGPETDLLRIVRGIKKVLKRRRFFLTGSESSPPEPVWCVMSVVFTRTDYMRFLGKIAARINKGLQAYFLTTSCWPQEYQKRSRKKLTSVRNAGQRRSNFASPLRPSPVIKYNRCCTHRQRRTAPFTNSTVQAVVPGRNLNSMRLTLRRISSRNLALVTVSVALASLA
jgi:hypothetical protein